MKLVNTDGKTILSIPCNIGDDIYFIPSKAIFELNILNGDEGFNKVYHQKVAKICVDAEYWWIECDLNLEYGVNRIFINKSYKETWFLSKEEAEIKLKLLERNCVFKKEVK